MRIAIDGREYTAGRLTGIARFISGLVTALSRSGVVEEVNLFVPNCAFIPDNLVKNNRVTLRELPGSFIAAERVLTDFTKNGIDCFLSPYRKLPLFGTHCSSINTVHDVLDLTHAAYRKHIKNTFDKIRFKSALAIANLTWYDSSFSRQETEKLIGCSGSNPRVRYLGMDDRFTPKTTVNEDALLARYKLTKGYILIIGNGLPHKNLSILLENASHFKRKLVFIGVPKKKQSHWRFLHPAADAVWLTQVIDEDLPVILRNAFCLAQPSTAEGYGYPPLEAMACGVPAVISDIPVLIETTGGCAVAADPQDSDSWRYAFDRLEDKAFYKNHVEKGLHWVRPLLGSKGWEKHIIDIKEIIEDKVK